MVDRVNWVREMTAFDVGGSREAESERMDDPQFRARPFMVDA
jgi:hypothetical protein